MLGFWSFRTYTLMNEGKSIMMSAGNIVLAAVVLGLLAYAHFSAVKQKSASEG
jgi:hypothetical protein